MQQLNAGLPPFWSFERALSHHYLRTDGGFGATPLSFMDVSPPQLARALGRDAEDGEDVLREFIALFAKLNLRRSLGEGIAVGAPKGVNAPGWFNYLVLSCHIASVSPDRASSGQFRRRLKDELGLPSEIATLTGIALLWEKTKAWCDRKREAGEPFRKIELPPIRRNMSQIGHSIDIVFPSRHDLDRMERLFGGLARRQNLLARDIVSAVRPHVFGHPWSQGFLRAFDDFDVRWRGGERLLADHPFVHGILGLRLPAANTKLQNDTFQLDLATDIDGNAAFSVLTDIPDVLSALTADPKVRSTRPIEVPLSLREVVDLLSERASHIPAGLLRCYREGVLPFEEVEWGVWRAVRMPVGGRVRPLVRDDILRKYDFPVLGRDGWQLLNPLGRRDIEAILRTVRDTLDVGSDIARLRIVGGIRIERSFLGRSRFLPELSASERCTASIVPFGDKQEHLSAFVEGARIVLRSEGPVEGVWRVAVSEGGSVRAEPSIAFVRDAPERAVVPADVLAKDWRPVEPPLIGTEERSITRPWQWSEIREAPDTLQDLLEALYATGARGWSEQGIVQLLERSLPAGASVWDGLQVLAESGWLEARVSREWRARRWYLRAPRLLRYADGSIVLSGAVAAQTRSRFLNAVIAAGGRAEERGLGGDWFVPIPIAHGVDVNKLSSMLAMEAEAATVEVPTVGAPARIVDSLYTSDRRIVGSRWNWKKARFVTFGGNAYGGVSLERLTTVKPNAADIYRISIDGEAIQIVDGRAAAIMLAHRLAQRPAFRFRKDGSTVCRLICSGTLPPEFARFLLISNACGPALAKDCAGGWEYVYPANPDQVRCLKAWMGASLDADGLAEPDALRSLVLARIRGAAGQIIGAERWGGG